MNQKKTVVVIDDSPANLQIIISSLRDHYHMRPFTSGLEGLRYFERGQHADLILLDIEMPGLSGFDTIERLKQMPESRAVPVVFLTGVMDAASEVEGLSLGAVDYIYKPFNPLLVRKRIDMHIALEAYSQGLECAVERKTQTIEKLNRIAIFTIISIIGTRDNETKGHISRTSEYVVALSKALRDEGLYETALTDDTIQQLWRSAPLHDVGKVGIPDHILSKPGKLSCDEFEIMKTHTSIGADAFVEARAMMGEPSFLDFAEVLARSHHEKWNGQGYPEGLSGNDIPLIARIMAIADVYDALISVRPYKQPIPHDQAVQIIVEGRGTHFDPQLVDAFLHIEGKFREIADRSGDDLLG